MNSKVMDIYKGNKTDGLSLYTKDQNTGISQMNDGGKTTYVSTSGTGSGKSTGSTGESSSGSSSDSSGTNIYLDEIQKAASEKNYKTLLQSDIAAYNLKMNTQKYLNNNLAASGLNTQGYGTSAHTGVENTAQNLYAENLATYNEAEQTAQTAAETRADAKSTENDNQLVTYLQYSDGSDEQIANYMKNYGYTQGKDGIWRNADGNEPSAYILSAIESAKNNNSTDTETKFAKTASAGSVGLTAGKSWMESARDEGGGMDEENMERLFGKNYMKYYNELDYIFQDATFQESVTNGLTVHLVNGSNDAYGAYFVYYDGKWYKTTAEYFSKASNKQTIKGK